MSNQTQTLDEQLEQEGFSRQGTVRLQERSQFDPSIRIYVTIGPTAGYDSESFSTIRKVADKLNCGRVYADLNAYADEGFGKLQAQAQEKAAELAEKLKDKPKEELEKAGKALNEAVGNAHMKLRQENYKKYSKNLAGHAAGLNKAFEGAQYTAKMAPYDYQFDTSRNQNLEPDLTREATGFGKALEVFIEENSRRPMLDLKYIREGKYLCITKLGKIKDEEGKEGIGIVEARLYRKADKEAKAETKDYRKAA